MQEIEGCSRNPITHTTAAGRPYSQTAGQRPFRNLARRSRNNYLNSFGCYMAVVFRRKLVMRGSRTTCLSLFSLLYSCTVRLRHPFNFFIERLDPPTEIVLETIGCFYHLLDQSLATYTAPVQCISSSTAPSEEFSQRRFFAKT